jgi:SAM-dependent methyltransferase
MTAPQFSVAPGVKLDTRTVKSSIKGNEVLNIGCGRVPVENAINVDLVPSVNADVVHDLNVRPWPFEDDRFAKVHARDVIEHLHDTVATMAEIHRVCRHGALVDITVPHFSAVGAFMDPTHRRFFAAGTFDYFAEGHHLSYYGSGAFRIRQLRIVFPPSTLNKIVWRLAERYRDAYERRFAWLFPASFIHAQLEVVKAR